MTHSWVTFVTDIWRTFLGNDAYKGQKTDEQQEEIDAHTDSPLKMRKTQESDIKNLNSQCENDTFINLVVVPWKFYPEMTSYRDTTWPGKSEWPQTDTNILLLRMWRTKKSMGQSTTVGKFALLHPQLVNWCHSLKFIHLKHLSPCNWLKYSIL